MPILKQLSNKAVFKSLYAFDQAFTQSQSGPVTLIGLDEVGRGSAIGSVVAAAVSLPENLSAAQKRLLSALNDSKKLKPVIRKELAEAILSFCRVGIGEAFQEEVDTLNVYHASLLADWRAYQAWCSQTGALYGPVSHCDASHWLWIDGKALVPQFPKLRQRAIVKGDGQSACIAAASVVAKEHRDAMITQLALAYPQYGWERNIGYLTPQHRLAIEQYGRTRYHRKNFLTRSEKQLLLPQLIL